MREVRYTALTLSDIHAGELAARLKMPRGTELSILEKCISEVRAVMAPKASAAEVEVTISGDEVKLGGLTVHSRDLAKNLRGCRSAAVMAVTLGAGVDMLLRRKSVTSPSEHFVCDGVASAFAETAADAAEEIFLENYPHRPRFSPGYGDLSLDIQSEVLSLCDAEKLLGIKLTDTKLMIPTKSVTAIIGRCD